MDAIDRLRESARNERTCLELNQVLRLKDDEIRSLQKRVAELEAEVERLKAALAVEWDGKKAFAKGRAAYYEHKIGWPTWRPGSKVKKVPLFCDLDKYQQAFWIAKATKDEAMKGGA